MTPSLDELKVCEDSFVPEPISETTVVLPKLWGRDLYAQHVSPLVEQHHLSVKSLGITFDGIAVTFATIEDSAMFRLFYDGDTETA